MTFSLRILPSPERARLARWPTVLVTAWASLPGTAHTPDASIQMDPLVGLWGVETTLRSQVHGELTVDTRTTPWQATLAGDHIEVRLDGDRVGFVLPGDRGELRGKFDRAAHVIHAYWTQPRGPLLQAPYATPVELREPSPSSFTGSVVPLEQRISVYLRVVAGADGHLTAVLVNPEVNLTRRRVFTVWRDGNKVRLHSTGQSIQGSYDSKAGTLSLQLVNFLPAFSFTRRTQDAAGFFARTPGGANDYQAPLAQDDGWVTGVLAQEELDEQPLRDLIGKILTADPADSRWSIHSLLIARHGRLVLEEYFHGFNRERTHDMRSAAKTFAPALVGLARERGVDLTPLTPVYRVLARYEPFQGWDARKQAVSLRDIMTMTAGSACDDNDDSSPGNEDRMQAATTDWYRYTLDLPMVRAPGGDKAVYCSADLNLVGGVVASASSQWLVELFDEGLARPLQFGRYYLNLMPDGQAYMGGGAYLRPRDALKLGQVFLDGGFWHGRRILAREWVEESMATHAHFDPRYSLGQEHGYGYGWHINELESGGTRYRAVAAQGNGGQFVVVIPDLDLVVGINGGAYGEFDHWYRWETELIPQYVIPAVTRRRRPEQ
jgi:CubicO group peptidase (beta-lactamase class C family)